MEDLMNRENFISTFCDLVKIPSEAPHDVEFISHMEKFFKAEGGKTHKDKYGSLVVKFAAKNSKSTSTIGFVCHADTVKPGMNIKPIIDGDIIRTDGSTVLGADDKAGIAGIIEILRSAKKHPPIEAIITRCEEPGSLGAINLDYSLIDSKMAFVLDMEYLNELVVGGPTIISIEANYKGRPAHAGVAPDKGISSILAASKAISRLRLGKIDDETTANVGTITGGEMRNIVPENTKVVAECRCLSHEKAEKLADEMEEIFKQGAREVGADVVIDRKMVLKAYMLSDKSDVVKHAKNSLTKLGVNPKVTVTRGGTDATYLNAHGIPTAVLGVGYRDNHSCNEHLIIKEAETMVKAMVDMVEGMA